MHVWSVTVCMCVFGEVGIEGKRVRRVSVCAPGHVLQYSATANEPIHSAAQSTEHRTHVLQGQWD